MKIIKKSQSVGADYCRRCPIRDNVLTYATASCAFDPVNFVFLEILLLFPPMIIQIDVHIQLLHTVYLSLKFGVVE